MSEDKTRTARPAERYDGTRARYRTGRRGLVRTGRGRRVLGEKPKNFKAAMGKLINYLGSYKTSIMVVLVFAALSLSLQSPVLKSRDGYYQVV